MTARRATLASLLVSVGLLAAATSPALGAPIEFNRGSLPGATTDYNGAQAVLPGQFDQVEGDDLLATRGVYEYTYYSWLASGDGSGGFGQPAQDSIDNPARYAADVDGDGRDDIIWPHGTRAPVVSFNEGAGQFSNGGFASYGTLDTADLDGDGDIDIVSTDGSGSGAERAGFRPFLNDGSGEFEPGAYIEPPTVLSGAPAIGDFDGDGALDVASCRQPAGGTTTRGPVVFLGDGAGGFTSSPPSGAAAKVPCSELAVGDLDGDGRDDLVSDQFDVYRGLASGGLERLDSIQSRHDAAESVAISDLDGDGALDAVFGADGVEIWTGIGDGSFDSSPGLRITEDVDDLAVVSLDGDGEPTDLVGLAAEDSVVTVWANVSGQTSPPPETLEPENRFPIDNEPPDPSLFSSDDPTAEIQCSLDYGAFGDCDDVLGQQIPDGRHVLSARAQSSDGVDPTPAQQVFKLDTVAPVITISRREDSPDPGFPSYIVRGEVDESEPDIVGTVKVPGGGRAAVPFHFFTYPGYITDIRYFDTRDLIKGSRKSSRGGYEMIVSAHDRAGNSTIVRRKFRVR